MEEMKELKEFVKVFLENEEKVEMDDIRRNYMKESEIKEELKNIGMKKHLQLNCASGYRFKKCAYCYGPMLGHLIQKCPKIEYDEKDVQRFEIHIKNIGGFKEAIWARMKRLGEEVEQIENQGLTEVAKMIESKIVPGTAVVAGGTTQLVKIRQQPL